MAQRFISKAEVAAMLGVDVRTISKYQDSEPDPLPIAVRGGRGRSHQYDIGAVYRWGLRRKLAEISGVDDEEPAEDYNAARARHTSAKADLAELELAEQRGRLLDAELVSKAWISAFTNFRARILAVPTKAAPLCAAAEGETPIRDILKSHVHEALNELAHGDIAGAVEDDLIAAGEGGKDGKAAA